MIKKCSDRILAMAVLLILLVPLLMIWIINCWNMRSNGLFYQTRIGQYGKPFTIYKLQTIHPKKRTISKWGSFLRATKWDEVPQLFNILKGEMSFVGPRPDIPGYADRLIGEDRIILQYKPGLTGIASIKYRDEEALLATVQNPLVYNDTIIWPDKVRINKWYAQHQSVLLDCKILWCTFWQRDWKGSPISDQ
ncbi:sugar transferase [Flavobacterium chuncheonense]|uniref:Sugar transferase n=1 Tax=Flavobacterium chuncheonense TaxID=2026653 RepID=A0ABW5YJ41_9FLAO